MLQALDLGLFRLINGLAGRSPVLDGLARLVVNDYLAPSAIVLLLVWLWLRGRSRAERSADSGVVVNAVAAQFVANIVLKVINLSYFRARPFDALPEANLVFYRPWDSSCPSNPATFAFAVAVAIYLGDRRLGKVALGVATLWGLSRVYSGVHYPLDVVAGAALGGSVAVWLSRYSQLMARLRPSLVSVLRKGLVA